MQTFLHALLQVRVLCVKRCYSAASLTSDINKAFSYGQLSLRGRSLLLSRETVVMVVKAPVALKVQMLHKHIATDDNIWNSPPSWDIVNIFVDLLK